MTTESDRRPHLSGYQNRDREVVDYQMYELGSTGLMFRGPEPAELPPGGYFTCIGAAQTLGCFCERPYPVLLAEQLGMPCLNLGYGGAGPEFFLGQESLLPYINGGRFVVIQVMSGRSQSNSLLETGGLEYVTRRSDGARMGANEAWDRLLRGSPALAGLPPRRIFRALARRLAAPTLLRTVDETRGNWCRNQLDLHQRITVPIVLLWISKRTPEYDDDPRSVRTLFGEFPQLINRSMIDRIREDVAAYVECVTERGSPQPLFSRFTGQPTTVDPTDDRRDLGGKGAGKPWTHNAYYPSPEMQEDAAAALFPHCQAFVR